MNERVELRTSRVINFRNARTIQCVVGPGWPLFISNGNVSPASITKYVGLPQSAFSIRDSTTIDLFNDRTSNDGQLWAHLETINCHNRPESRTMNLLSRLKLIFASSIAPAKLCVSPVLCRKYCFTFECIFRTMVPRYSRERRSADSSLLLPSVGRNASFSSFFARTWPDRFQSGYHA